MGQGFRPFVVYPPSCRGGGFYTTEINPGWPLVLRGPLGETHFLDLCLVRIWSARRSVLNYVQCLSSDLPGTDVSNRPQSCLPEIISGSSFILLLDLI